MKVVKRVLLNGPTYHSGRIIAFYIIYYIAHIGKRWLVEHKAKCTFFVVLAKQNDSSLKIRVRKKGLRY